MARAARFIPKDARIAKAKAEEARQAVLALGLPESATEDIMVTIARHENGGRLDDWKFNMISPAQCLAVWEAVRKLPRADRPDLTRRVFDFVLTHIETNTGTVTLTREELAERCEAHPDEISRVMGVLERMGVIFRQRRKVAGMRGPGIVRYYLNQHVAWNGDLVVRKEQAQQVPLPLPFSVIDGGKHT